MCGGRATLGVGNQCVELERGDVVLFQAGQDHELLTATSDLELHVVALKPSLAELVPGLRLGPVGSRAQLGAPELSAVQQKLADMADVCDATTIDAQLADVFTTIAPRLERVHVLSRRALELVRAERAWSEERLAARVGASVSQLSRHFHHDLGVRFSEYRARLRLMQFVKLVDAGQTLSHAAFDADFGSYAQCHRVFRRLLGCAPKDYFAGARRAVDASCAPIRP